MTNPYGADETSGFDHPGRALVRLAERIGRHASDRQHNLRAISETAALLLKVPRASIWLFDEQRARIECVDLFEVESAKHSHGLLLEQAAYPHYFRALEAERIIDAHDAHADPRTQEFSESYLSPLGIGAMLDAPIRLRGQMIGVVCHENIGAARQWTAEEKSLAATMGDFVALSIESAERARSEHERQRIEARLARAQKMEALGRLAGGIAHDFNNLLTAVQGSLELLRDAIDRDRLDDAFLQGELGQIGQAADRAGRLTRQLSGFSRTEVTDPRRIHPPAMIESLHGVLQRMLGSAVTIELAMHPETPWIQMDPSQFEQVLINLATNASDAMAQGGTLRIETRPASDRTGRPLCELRVQDTGHGIAPEVLPLIFEPFYSTKEVGTGWGLGLATVQGIVENNGGEVLVRSEPQRGTSFRIQLPAINPPPPRSESEPKADPGEMPGGDETILLCEDDARIREQLTRTLRERGYEVIVASDGREAKAHIEEQGERVQLLLTDVVMPGASGPRIAALLRDKIPEPKVLFISGYSADAVKRSGLDAKAEMFLPKPFRPSDALRKVRRVLDGV